MNEPSHNHAITITASNNDVLELELNHAVERVREKAVTEGLRGILITQEAPGRFTVALHDEVPFGLTREKRLW